MKSRPCSGGIEAAKIKMEVRRPEGGDPRSLARIKRLEKGSKITYRPIDLPPDMKTNARVALVLGSVQESGSGPSLTVLEFKPAGISADWVAPFRASLAIFVIGPQGLDEKRLASLVSRDEALLAALADYADQTDEIEDTVELLTALEEGEDVDPDEASRLDRSNPTEQALSTLLRAMNSGLMVNNPMGQGRSMGPVTLMNKASVGFFDNAGGLFFGGGALTELKPLLMPDTDFRAAFVQRSGESLSLCAPRPTARTRNRQVYLWAHRIIDSPAPSLTLSTEKRAAIGAKSTIGAQAVKPADWKLIDRVDRWTLTPVSGGEALPVKVRPTLQGHNLEFDLRGFPGAPGPYILRGEWDWEPVPVSGNAELARLGDLKQARVSSAGAVRLLEGGGVTPLVLDGVDFQFVERASIRPVGGQPEVAQPVQFILPRGKRMGTQTQITLDIDTRSLHGGQYLLALQQADGKSQDIPLGVNSAAGRIENLPLRVSGSTAPQRLTLHGVQLDQIAKVDVVGATVKLDAASRPGERVATLQFTAAHNRGDKVDLTVTLSSGAQAQQVGAIEVLGQAPRITKARASLPAEPGVALKEGEIPAGVMVTFQLQEEGSDPIAAIRTNCGATEQRMAAGERTAAGGATLLPGNALLLSLRGNGSACTLTAALESPEGLLSEPYPLGRLVRIPLIESISFTGDRATDGTYAAMLTGRDLDAIERTGWNAGAGVAVTSLPEPVLSQPEKQLLRVSMPWPSPAPRAQVFVWLRGETDGRATSARY